MAAYDVARLGVYLHGLAGEIAATLLSTRGMTALDVSAMLGEAWKCLEAGDEIT
jgi:NAD(P)H-hydrate epimerase